MPAPTYSPLRMALGVLLVAGCPLAWSAPGNSIVASTFHTRDSDRGSGDFLQFAIPLFGLGMSVVKNDSDGMKEWGYDILGSIAATEMLKKAVNNTAWGPRPDGGQYSFPSGHTTMACAGAGFIGRRYGWEYGSAAMMPAALVGWSRVDEGVHHWRDVIAGCAMGIGLSYLFVQPQEQKFTILPEIYRDGAGLSFNMKY